MYEAELKKLLLERGADDCGFCALGEHASPRFPQYGCAVSIVKALSRAVVSTITDRPGMIYFQHYRAVNARLDQLALDAVSFIESKGAFALPVAASQSVPGDKYSGVFSHKTAAVLSGMGQVGRNNLLLHPRYGPCIRLATVLTDLPLEDPAPLTGVHVCADCDICIRACPAGALDSENGYDARKCSEYMKNFRDEGRGAVCGLCMKACPLTQRYTDPRQ
ncbi:MAG: epoxyqueuosine reductase [Clostridia bacterium]|nr:epoxyqueuosine reductase [Clostridia bacterium]